MLLTSYQKKLVFQSIISGHWDFHAHPTLYGAHASLRSRASRLCRMARARRKLTQAEVAHNLHRSQNHAFRVENPTLDITLTTLEQYAAALGYFVEITFNPNKTA